MAERMKELFNKILEWWNKFSSRQKTFIISAGAGVVLAFAILITVLVRPQYVVLLNCKDRKEASTVSELLEGEGYDYKVSDDAYQIKINKNQLANANMLLAANDVQSYSYTIDNVTDGGFGTTESDKQKKYEVYLESRLGNDLIGRYSAVKSAVVDLYIPERDGTLIQKEEESSIWIQLELQGEFNEENVAGMAKAVSVAIGNKTTENVVITDTEGNLLFTGEEEYTAAGSVSTQMGVKSQWEKKIKNEVRQVMLGTNEFERVEVAVNLNMDFSSISETDHEYYVADGNTQGYLASDRTFSSESTNASGEVPGTDSNGQQPEYVYQDSSDSSSATTETENKYLPSERITNRETLPGSINYDTSTISLSAINMNVVREEDVKSQGLLDGISWEEYKLQNAGRSQVTVSDDLYNVVAMATGFPRDNIAIVAYSENVFFDREGLNISVADAVQIAIILVILGLLAFVVLRSMRSEKAPEQPEEISVESLLQSQPESSLEDINAEQVSETRALIEKFVDENPEAAASLLRNWLNEDWG